MENVRQADVRKLYRPFSLRHTIDIVMWGLNWLKALFPNKSPLSHPISCVTDAPPLSREKHGGPGCPLICPIKPPLCFSVMYSSSWDGPSLPGHSWLACCFTHTNTLAPSSTHTSLMRPSDAVAHTLGGYLNSHILSASSQERLVLIETPMISVSDGVCL